MTEHNGQQEKQHLTTAQLSALLDEQLPIEEREFSDAHLATCEQCKQELESLRQTVMLLRALPRPKLPRSFALPLSTQQTEQQIDTTTPITPITAHSRTSRRNDTRSYYARTALRTFGTLAAMVGLVLLLSSLLPFVNGRSNGTTASNGSSQATPTSRQGTPVSSPSILPHLQGTAEQPLTQPTQSTQGSTVNAPSLPPLLDITTIIGRTFFGLLLLILGIIALIIGRREQHQGP